MESKSGNKNLTLRYALIQSVFWMQFAVIMGYASMYLLEHHFTNGQIGLLIAAAGTISALLQPVVASYADRPESISLKKIMFFSCIVMTATALLLALFGTNPVLTGLLYGGCIALLQLLNPLVNSLGMESINQGKNLNFGVARGIGSVAYAVAAYAVGILVEKCGVSMVPFVIAVLMLGFFAVLVLFPFEKTKREAEPGNASAGKPKAGARSADSGTYGPFAFFCKYKRFSFVLVGCVLIYISHVLLNNFLYQIIESKGGGSAENGVSMALAAVLELPTMFLFAYMVKKVRCDIWFRISGIFFMVKMLGSLLAPSIPVFYGMQIFQMFGWALMTVACVYYVNSIMEEQDVIKGQAYMTMTYTLGSVIGSLVGGWLIDLGGVDAMLIFGTAVSAVGMLIMLFGAQRSDR